MIDYQVYIDRLKQGKAQKRDELDHQRKELLDRLPQIAGVLKEKYGVHHVYVFGSLLSSDFFHERSDVDLAVSPISDEHYFSAYSTAWEMVGNLGLDFIDLDHCSESLKTEIITKGREIT
jgi:predicted nucleotidyltransferase